MSRALKLKVCGMREPNNILGVAKLNPDFMGFNFYANSKRYVGDDFAIPAHLPKEIKRVGVFVNEDIQKIKLHVLTHRLEFVQLHGNESVETCSALSESVKVIKVFRVGTDFDFSQIKPFISSATFFLFDTKTDAYGGSGETFDWSLLRRYDQSVPFFLAGGLTSGNILQAKTLGDLNIFGLDVNSGAESSPGIKDVGILNDISYKTKLLFA